LTAQPGLGHSIVVVRIEATRESLSDASTFGNNLHYGNEIATLRSQSLSDASTFGNNLHYGNEIATLRSQ
jgi:hypothetical protein